MTAGLAFVRKHGFEVVIRNANVAGLDRAPEQVFGEQNMEFPVSLLTNLQDGQQYRALGIIAPVFEAEDQIAFVMGLSGFTQVFRGSEIRRAGRRLREACDRVTTFITGSSPPHPRGAEN
jgi:hypothetical protein